MKNKYNYIPIMLKTDNVNAAIIGGGNVAFRKAKSIYKKCKSLKIIAPEISDNFRDLNKVNFVNRKYRKSDLKNLDLLYVAIDNVKDRNKIYKDLKDYPNIITNFCDFQDYCDFISPAVINKGDFTIAISSNGTNPQKCAKLKFEIKNDKCNWNKF